MLSVLVFGLSLTAGFAFFTYQTYWLTVTSTLNGLMNFADAKQQGVIRFLDQNEKLAKQLALQAEQSGDDALRRQFRNIVLTDTFDLENHPFKDEIVAGNRRIPTFRVYHVIDYVERGVIRISSESSREGKQWDRHIDTTHGYSDPWLDGGRNVLTFTAQNKIGTVYVHADALMLTNIVSGEIGNLAGDMGAFYLAGVGKTFDYYLVDRGNRLITESRMRPGQFLRGRGSELPWRTTLQQAGVVCGKAGTYTTNARCITGCREVMGQYVGEDGNTKLGVSMPFYDSGWTLVVEQDKWDLLAPMLLMFAKQMSLLVVVGVLSIYLYLRLQDRVLIRPLRKLQLAIEDVERTRNFTKPIEFESKDEFGVLGNAFNRMSHNMDLVYRNLEQRVAERTHQLTIVNDEIRASLHASQLMQEKLSLSEQVAKQMATELELQKLALDQHAIVSITDVTGTITYANDLFCKISQYSREELLGHNHRLLNSGFHARTYWSGMFRSISRGKVWHGEVCNRAKDGSLYWLDMTVVPFMDERGKPYQYISIRTDITERMRSKEEIEQLAYFDPLTNLPNRRLFIERLKQSLKANVRNGKHGAVLFIDLDNFKKLNDTRGHSAGDHLLVDVAARLKECVRDVDTVARLGGDEFVVVLEGLSGIHAEACSMAEHVARKIQKSINRPYLFEDYEHYSSPSIGIAMFCDHSVNVEEIIQQADAAMYLSKKAGRNTVSFYDYSMQAVLEARNLLESALHHALELGQLMLHYQVQVNEDYVPFGAEALLRWKHPDIGDVSPAQFIPLAEENGLIIPIGDWVIATACQQLKIWQESPRTKSLSLSVNVSVRQLREPEFVRKLHQILVHTGIAPERLKIEITESMMVDEVESMIAILHQVRVLGVQLSMDDFGTGYSSLSVLKRLPITQLKIDQSFVRDIEVDDHDRAIVRTIIALAHSMELTLIAEGVETEGQRARLAIKGCSNYQGFLFSKPLPLDEFETLMSRCCGGGVNPN